MSSPNISYSMKLRGVSVRERNCERNFCSSASFFADTGPDLACPRTSAHGRVSEIQQRRVELLVNLAGADGEPQTRGFGRQGWLQMKASLTGKYRDRLAAENRSQQAELPGLESKSPDVTLEDYVLSVKGFRQFPIPQRAVVRVLGLPQQANRHE